MKKEFTEFIKGRVYLDGGTGSELVKYGVPTLHAEVLNIERPELVREIHEKYLAAGSNVIYTNTFGCNRRKADLTKYTLKELIEAGIRNAKESAEKYGGYVLYDCGPTGELLYPYGRMSFEEAYCLFAEQAEIVKDSGADGVVIETVSDLQEMRAAILAFKEITNLPVICSMTFEETGRTFAGVSAESFALCAQALGAAAIGANCGTGAAGMKKAVASLVRHARVPVFAKPNAGLPRYENGRTVYDVDAETFGLQMRELAFAGAGILGGCCGTDEKYIACTVRATADIPAVENKNYTDAVCSYSRVVNFGEKQPLVIGERVNPTNKPLLKQAILDDNYDYILSMCVEQAEQGADLLDINLGMTGIDEREKLVSAVAHIQGVADLPLVIDTSKKEALESAVRVTDGICVINSVSADEKSAEKVFPVAKKYGSYIIALCMDEKGIPSDTEGRIAAAKKIIALAEKYGVGKEKLIFDPLTMAVSVDVSNGIKVLESIKRLRSELGVKTALGLSNISFGLPDRAKINAAFLKMVTEEGVTAVIINPVLKEGDDPAAIKLLKGEDEACKEYIALNSGKEIKRETQSLKHDICYCIKKGQTSEAVRAVKEEATEENYSEIIESGIIKGLNELGAMYEKGEAFLPQLIAGSEAAKAALDYIKEKYIGEKGESNKGTVILATVKGDVHDIGKNIVKAVTANYGYRIIDLGKDVPPEEILRAAEKYLPDAVGLSALMTTTIDNMTDTVRLLKERYPEIPVIVGGAVVTKTYADGIGAIYSKDAQTNVKILEKLFANR